MIKKFALLLLLVNVVFASPIYKDAETWINGGSDAIPGQAPFMASMRHSSNMSPRCGAAVISNRWVLSAAHCAEVAPSIIRIVVGSLQISRGGVAHNVQRIVLHPNYRASNGNGHWDITCIQTVTTITFNADVQPAALGHTEIAPNTLVAVTGWGATDPNRSVFPDRLQILIFRTMSNQDCRNRAGPNVVDHKLCLASNPGIGLCSGDSGSPYFIRNEIVAVHSWGFAPCGSGMPNGGIRISHTRNWILNTIR